MQQITVNPQPPPAASGLNIGDIYYTIFRHKWKIIIPTLAGIIAAACVYFLQPPVYVSQAKLFLRYVLETKPNIEPGTTDSQMRAPDNRGDSIINSEIEILTSMDLATNVVDAIGPARILARVNGGTNRTAAASYLQAHVKAESLKRDNVITVTCEHPDPALPQLVLTYWIEAYRQKHVQIHRALGIFDDFLTKQSDDLRAKLNQTEEQLRKAKSDADVTSVEDGKRAFEEQVAKISQEIRNAEADLAERQATLAELSGLAGNRAQGAEPAQAPAPLSPPPLEKVDDYRKVSLRLDRDLKLYTDLTTRFTSENAQVKRVQQDMDEGEKAKRALEQEYPALARLNVANSNGAPSPAIDLSAEQARAIATKARLGARNKQLADVQAKAANLEKNESEITQLQRQKDLQEQQYRSYSAGLEQARVDEALGAAKTANITQVEAPAPPGGRQSGKLYKLLAGIVAGGFGLGLALALGSDKVLDQTLRRPIEVENRLRLPLFLSVPDISRNGHRRFGTSKRHRQLPAPSATPSADPAPAADPQPTGGRNGKLEIAPWDAHHGLRAYYESLRDRLITYFEVRNMTHRPKLVAVTGCNRGCGATTLATGLAACLSETGEGNVLLVDMTTEHGDAHPFHKGQPECDLAGVLDNGKRDSAMVQHNLYRVSETTPNGGLPRVLPKRFMNLVPRLKGSDYDYIIFDMPAIDQTSVTPRLAGFMDMVLLVIESEKTDGDIAKRACDLLAESKANVSTVLNKRRTYVPEWLHHEW